MAPYAELDDGLIDLLVVDANISRRRLFTVLPKLFDGTHVSEPEVSYYQASSFSILSDTDDILNIDGDPVTTFEIHPVPIPQIHSFYFLLVIERDVHFRTGPDFPKMYSLKCGLYPIAHVAYPRSPSQLSSKPSPGTKSGSMAL